MNKKILIVYPHNFFKQDSGINQRFFEYYLYFKNRGFVIDILGLKGFESKWTENDINEINNTYKVNKIEFGKFDFEKNKIQRLIQKIQRKLYKKETKLPDLCTKSLHKKFESLNKKTEYDYILFGYIYWANLLNNSLKIKAKMVIDISDDLTLQHYFKEKNDYITLGNYFGDELKKISKFDISLYISQQELDQFSKFIPQQKHYYIPMFCEKKMTPYVGGIDILYIASNNDHNKISVKWFLENVYPLLPSECTFLFVGKICDSVGDFPNIQKIKYLENLDEAYEKTKVCICPMLTGTGMKIKTVEALSYGKPVVGNYKSVDGFLSKERSGCLIANDPNAFADYIIHLINDEGFYNNIQKEGDDYFEKHFSIKMIYNKLDEIFG